MLVIVLCLLLLLLLLCSDAAVFILEPGISTALPSVWERIRWCQEFSLRQNDREKW